MNLLNKYYEKIHNKREIEFFHFYVALHIRLIELFIICIKWLFLNYKININKVKDINFFKFKLNLFNIT